MAVADPWGLVTTVTTRLGDPPTGEAALRAVAAERERLRLWAGSDDARRNYVEAIVHASLERLLANPAWIPGSVELGERQLRIEIVVELDATQAAASREAAALNVRSLAARESMTALMGRLEALSGEETHG